MYGGIKERAERMGRWLIFMGYDRRGNRTRKKCVNWVRYLTRHAVERTLVNFTIIVSTCTLQIAAVR